MIYLLADLIVAGWSCIVYQQIINSKPFPFLSKCIINCAEVICAEIIIPNGKNIVVASVYRALNRRLLICEC